MLENQRRPQTVLTLDPVVVDRSANAFRRTVSNKNMVDERWTYQFINNIFSDFVKASVDYFGDLYPRFQHKVVGTYDKAVEYINKLNQYDHRVPNKPNLPAIILNPTGDFGLDESASTARQLWRFPNLAPGMISRLYDPIYEDNDVRVCVGFTRLKGEFDMIALLPSFYEYFDLRVLLIQMFGDVGRVIYPQWFSSFLILPSELYLYEYKNQYTGVVHTLDWQKSKVSDQLIRTTNKNEMVVPVKMKPLYKLISLSDASTRYGVADNLADWKLGFNVEYQLEMPSMMMVITDHLVENVELEVKTIVNYSHVKYDENTYPVRDIVKYHWDVTIDSTSEDYFQVIQGDAEKTEDNEFILTNTQIYIVSQADVDSTSDIVITLLEAVLDPDILLLLSTYGYMDYKDHYDISSDGWTLIIRKQYVQLEENQVIKLLYYNEQFEEISGTLGHGPLGHTPLGH